MLSPKEFPYTGPLFGPSDARGPASAPTVEAIGRAMWRQGFLKEPPKSGRYTVAIEQAVRRFQRLKKLYVSGQYGHGTWMELRSARVPKGRPHAGEYLLDALALSLVQSDTLPSSPEERVKTQMVEYLVACERYKAGIHYEQFRPMNHLRRNPKYGFTCDCSGLTTSAFYVAGAPDPNGLNFNGLGNSQTQYQHNKGRVVHSPYEIGDLAIYGPSTWRTSHITVCFDEGNNDAAAFMSHGSDAGPYGTRLWYRNDLLVVVRPKLLL